MFKHLVLYEAGLMELKYGSVSCRTLRTEMAHCMSDTEFLAKLHCVRLGMEDVFRVPDNRQYFTDVGRQIISRLLIEADRDPEDFYSAYASMMDFVNNRDNSSMMEEELRGRGVKNFTFFDVVLDFILMDAFDDLEHPPSSVITVVQNRWLSNGFKETTLLFSILLIGLVNVHAALASQCACATVAVNVRTVAGVGHHVLTTLQNGHCLTFKGHRHTVGGASWVNVDWHGRDGWIHSSYVHISTCSASHHPHGHPVRLPGCPHIITRAEWGARPKPSNPPMLTHTPRYMFIHHGATPGCTTKAACIARVKGYQNYHMDHHQWGDIGYSFVVGEDGNVYEARGWDEVGAHTYGYNSVGLAICVVGNFMDHVPNHAALAAVKAMIACGLANNKLTATYKLDGHRDVGSTSCPGTSFENLIKGWPHY